MTQIKICGITSAHDARLAAELGVDMLGFIFYKKSPRCIDPAKVGAITGELPQAIERVGVFVDEPEESVRAIIEEAGLTAVQFHGAETAAYCALFADGLKVIKAFRVAADHDLTAVNDYPASYYLFDTFVKGTPGGTGKAFDWKMLSAREIMRPVILSGGLTADTVCAAIREVSPFGVDVSSGVEKAPGVKDPALMGRFVEQVRKCD